MQFDSNQLLFLKHTWGVRENLFTMFLQPICLATPSQVRSISCAAESDGQALLTVHIEGAKQVNFTKGRVPLSKDSNQSRNWQTFWVVGHQLVLKCERERWRRSGWMECFGDPTQRRKNISWDMKKTGGLLSFKWTKAKWLENVCLWSPMVVNSLLKWA